MPIQEKQLENYLENLQQTVGQHNSKLIIEYVQKCRALPSEPSASRLRTVSVRLASVSRMLKNKKLDELNEKDIEELNLCMRKRGMRSSKYYRKVLKQFLQLKDKKKYFDLLDSAYLREGKRSKREKLVDAAKFWSQKEVEAYLLESKRHSKRQAAWAALWLGTGCRPHELFNLRVKDVEWTPQTASGNPMLIIRIREGKTGARIIPFTNSEALGVWEYVEPYLKTLKDNAFLFSVSYSGMKKVHKGITLRAKIGEEKSINFYVARKMALTKFYSELGVVKGAKLAGHVPGSSIMKNYVDVSEEQLTEKALPTVAAKHCPNPLCCNADNMAHETQCRKCGSPLDREKFAGILKQNLAELVDAKLELLKKEIENRLLTLKVPK